MRGGPVGRTVRKAVEAVSDDGDRDAGKALLVRFGKASNVGDGVLACVTPDFAWRLAKGLEAPDGLIVRGKEVARQALAERAAVPAHLLLGNRVTIAGDWIIDGSALPASGQLALRSWHEHQRL